MFLREVFFVVHLGFAWKDLTTTDLIFLTPEVENVSCSCCLFSTVAKPSHPFPLNPLKLLPFAVSAEMSR